MLDAYESLVREVNENIELGRESVDIADLIPLVEELRFPLLVVAACKMEGGEGFDDMLEERDEILELKDYPL